jgi:predicted TIM-barrel fold metal-dependent hydrolase
MPGLLPCVAEQPLVDHHCHGVLCRDADEATLESLLNEGSGFPGGGSAFDSQAGFAFRRLCPPVIGLPPHAELPDYVARRAELGATEVTKRFLEAAGLFCLCVDTGFTPEPLTSPAELGGLAGAAAHEIVRLERVAEDVAAAGTDAAGFADAVRSALATRTAEAVGVKSIAAYRTGLELPAERPSDSEVRAAAGRWLADRSLPPRLADQTLQRFLIWCGVDLRLPVQFHVGYGDSDVDLDRCNPLLLTPLLRAIQPTGVPVMLLHNYPYHREAGYLAQVFPHVYVDAGLATHNLGARAPALLAEALELAPFGKFLYSSDAFGLPELYYLGAALFRSALSAFLRSGLEEDLYTERTAARLARMLCADNAKRAYRLADQMLTASPRAAVSRASAGWLASSQRTRGSRRNQDSWRRANRLVAFVVSSRASSRVHSPSR